MGHPIQVFCCYAREDQPYLLLLKKYLALLERRGLLTVQADIDVSPGEEWEKKISDYLNTAQMILLLISVDFMASNYCYSKEMKRALERHKAGEACVIPIILRPVNLQGAPFSKLQALPENARPITSWSNQDEAFFNVEKGFREALEKHLILRRPQELALFGYETQGGNTSLLWSNPQAFSLHELYETYLDWSEEKRGFTEEEIIDHTWVKAGDHGYAFVIHFLPHGQFHEDPVSGSIRQLQGSWQLVDGVLKTTIEQEGIVYTLDIFANKHGLVHSGIEFSGQNTSPNYFVFLPSQQSLTNRCEEAITAFRQLLDVNQNCAEVYKAIGDLLRDLGRSEEALNAYQQTLEIRPDYMWAWYDTGNVLYKLGRLDNALAAFDRTIEFDRQNQNAWAWYEKGRVLSALKRHQDALTAYDRALQISPGNAWFWHRKGQTLRELQRYQDALAAYEQALKVDSAFAKSYNGIGNILYRYLKRYEEAVTAYQRAIEIQSDYMWAWHNLGNVLHELQHFEGALKAYRRTTEIDPDYFWAWHNLGDALHALGHLEEALVAFDQAIKRDERVAVTWRERGKTLQELERYEEALTSYEHALELTSSSTLVWTRKGQVLHALKHYAEAITAYDRALELEANDVDVYLDKGRAYLGLANYDEALHTYEQAISIAPDNTWAWHDKGQALGYLQRAEEALTAFDRAIEFDPENKWAWLHRAETLEHLARLSYQKAGQPGKKPLKREYYNLLHKATGKCLDADGTTVYMHDPNGGRYQRWKATEVAPGIIILRHFQSGLVLGSTVERGTYLSEYTNNPTQQWIAEDRDSKHGYKKFKHVATGMVLHGDINNDVYLQPDNGGDFQAWMVAKISITPLIMDASESLTFE